MHGRKKENISAQEQKKRLAKVQWYRNLMDTIMEKRKNKEYDDEALSLTSEVLRNIPDLNSLWNYRKEVLHHLKGTLEENELAELVERELKLTKDCLVNQPKSYGTWHQRCYVLDHISRSPNFEKELQLCNYYLELDERNFHCWDYRRFVTDRENLSPSKELKYSTERIEANFSNYSAWHYRSKLLPIVYPDPNNHLPIEQEKYVEEFSMVESAVFTEPKDQSAWFYQRWLLGERSSDVRIISCGLLSNGHTFVVFNQLVDLDPSSSIKLNSNVFVKWSSVNNLRKALVWISTENTKHSELHLIIDSKTVEKVVFNAENLYVCSEYSFYQALNDDLRLEVKKQLSSIETLIKMEPDNKFSLLTSITLLQHLNEEGSNSVILNRYDELKKLDPLREKFYCDSESKYKMEHYIQSKPPTSETETPQKFMDWHSRKVDLSSLQLTSLHHLHCFAHCVEVNFSNNKLSNNCLKHLSQLVSCETLILSQCSLTSLQSLSFLPSLLTLDVSNNSINHVEDSVFEPFENHVRVILIGNPVCDNIVVKHCTIVV